MSTVSRPALLAALAVVVLGAVGCGSSSNNNNASSSATTTASSTAGTAGSAATTTAATGATDNITIQNFKFNPDPLNVRQGTKVTVAILDDGVPHSVTADDGSFDTGIFTKSSGPKTITLSKTGTFKYHCQVHSFMHGTIDVS
ncbi:MAG: cupredoxin domain-containing protein [Acidimicrobiia bacterium]|nr:cupredoxin domain-containing protein [Acidimicrobiia bacterium]